MLTQLKQTMQLLRCSSVDAASSLRYGYTVILLNDVFTAANSIYVKKKLDSKELGTFGLMYYNCAYCFPVAAFIVYQEGRVAEVLEFEYWASPTFMALYVVAQGTAPRNECLLNLRLLPIASAIEACVLRIAPC